MNIVVQRSGALGDVVLTTPIVRRLRWENPDADIEVETAYPGVFKNSVRLRKLANGVIPDVETRYINLNLVYERKPDQHIVQAYMQEVFGDTGNPDHLQQELFYSRRKIYERPRDKLVAVHAAVAGWRNRTLPRQVWQSVVTKLQAKGYRPILVGSFPRDDIPDCDVVRLYSTDILTQAQVIASCVAFIGSDSGLLHIAGATDTPIVGIFTCARPETRLPWRNSVLGGGCVSIVPNISCAGCQARRTPPVTDEHCERGDRACVSLVSAEQILAAFTQVMKQ